MSGASILAAALVTGPNDFFVGVAASSFVGGVIDLILRLRESLRKRLFGKVFGTSSLAGDTVFVIPEFRIRSEVLELARGKHISPARIFGKPRQEGDSRPDHWIDVKACVAGNDLEALQKLASTFAHVGGVSPNIMTDVKTKEPGVYLPNIVSFGLASNEITHGYVESGAPHAFELLPYPEAIGSQRYIRLPFLADSHPRSRWLEREGTDIYEAEQAGIFRSTADEQIGVLLRQRRVREGRPESIWWICGGLGPIGTLGASHILSLCWKSIGRYLRQQPECSELLILVRVRVHESLDETKVIRCFADGVEVEWKPLVSSTNTSWGWGRL